MHYPYGVIDCPQSKRYGQCIAFGYIYIKRQSIASKFCSAKQSFAKAKPLEAMHCLRLYKEAIDLKLRFKCIKNKVFDRLPIHRIHNLRLCKEGDVRRGQCITPVGGNRLPIHRIHNLRLCKEGDVRRGQCIAFFI